MLQIFELLSILIRNAIQCHKRVAIYMHLEVVEFIGGQGVKSYTRTRKEKRRVSSAQRSLVRLEEIEGYFIVLGYQELKETGPMATHWG